MAQRQTVMSDQEAPKTFNATVLTLYPEMFPGPLGQSLAGTALKNGIWELETVDIRDFSRDKHRSVDDAPFGGGPGMVMRADVLSDAIAAVQNNEPAANRDTAQNRPLLYLSPRGKVLTQERVKSLAKGDGVILLCGRFEGVDQRVLDAAHSETVIEEVSIGDYVLSGGEPAALVLLDAVIRLLPGVMGAAETLSEESFEGGLLEYPHYTRPAEWQGRSVPEVLLSGHHGRIAEWRQAERERLTKERRPDLWQQFVDKNNKAD